MAPKRPATPARALAVKMLTALGGRDGAGPGRGATRRRRLLAMTDSRPRLTTPSEPGFVAYYLVTPR
jgi:hypothetical protein